MTTELTCGVQQGSVLGSLLWNVLYDGILKYLVKSAHKYLIYCRILSRIGGASENARRLLQAVVESTTLYAASTWEDAWLLKKNRRKMESLKRSDL